MKGKNLNKYRPLEVIQKLRKFPTYFIAPEPKRNLGFTVSNQTGLGETLTAISCIHIAKDGSTFPRDTATTYSFKRKKN